VAVDHVGHGVGSGVGGDHHGGDAGPVDVIVPGRVVGAQARGDVVGRDRRRWGDVVVVAAMLVIEVDEQRVPPRRGGEHGADHALDERLSEGDVPRALLAAALGADLLPGPGGDGGATAPRTLPPTTPGAPMSESTKLTAGSVPAAQSA